MVMNPKVDEKIIGSMVESFLKGSYQKLKGWLGPNEDVCIIGTDSNDVPYSICVRAVLEKAGHSVSYTEIDRLFKNSRKVEGCDKILLIDNGDKVSIHASSFARGLLRDGYDSNRFRYMNQSAIADARGTFRMYLEQNLRRQQM